MASLLRTVTWMTLATLALSGQTWRPEDLPSPQNDRAGVCGRPGVKSSVCDPDGFLGERERNELDGLINMIAEGTGGYEVAQCGDHVTGYQIAVLIIERMTGGYEFRHSTSERAALFAREIHTSWGVGDAACENGVVVFVAVDDRRVFISTGAGTKQVLTDKRTQQLTDAMRGPLRAGNYGVALSRAVDHIGIIVSGRAVPEAPNMDFGGWLPGLFFFLVCCPCMCCGQAASHRRNRRYSTCRAALRRIDNDTSAARAGAYTATSCPICLEQFATPTDDEKKKSDAGDVVDVEAALLPSSRDASTRTSNDTPADRNARVALPCGHSFHSVCISDWVDGGSGGEQNRQQCPVCRASVDGGAGPTAGLAMAQDSELGMFEEERRFRIRRAHDIYPDFITMSMMNNYMGNRHVTMETHTSFARLDPALAAQAQSVGSGGSSFSFGGGSSFGGGGAGSSF